MSINATARGLLRPLRHQGIWWTLALGYCGCSAGVDDGLKKFPVRGAVLVNGEPAVGMVVTFNNLDRNAPGNATRPVGRTDAEGRFALSTNGEKDGAIEGQYTVTFFWPSDEGAMPVDRLGGRFNDSGRSTFRPIVEPKANDLEAFRLDLDPKLLKPGRAGKTPPQ